jgi:hypothetical protein
MRSDSVFCTGEEVEDLGVAPGAAAELEVAEIRRAASLSTSPSWRRGVGEFWRGRG